jgi:hypothetical protein
MPSQSLDVLVISAFDGRNANVIRDFLFSFHAHSRHRFHYVFDGRILGEATDFSAFDVILIFWSFYLLGPAPSPTVRRRIKTATALKVLFLQDEYREVRAMNQAMDELGIQLMFTCVAERDHETFYPPALLPTLRATYTVLPGYVPAYLEGRHQPVSPRRALDVAYRSRDVPFYLGDLGREKRIIADRFQEICRAHGLGADISVQERDRLYGQAWIDFLRSSRCVLGTPSGASVVDFSGGIRENCERHLREYPDTAYEIVKARYFADVDGKVVIDTVSPRVFEAAALHCAMVHHEGAYAGVIEPDRHYICVKRDYSNVGEVVDRINDVAFCREIADNAHRDLVASGRYGYRAFVTWFDAQLKRHIPARLRSKASSPALFYARNYVRHGQGIVPRGGTFVVVPSYHVLLAPIRRALRRLPGSRRPLLGRFLENPSNFVRRVRTAIELGISVPSFRAVMSAYVRHRRIRRGAQAWRLTDDLLKVDIARRARAGTLVTHPRFGILVEFDPALAVLQLTSFRCVNDPPPSSPLAPDVEEAVLGGRVQTMVWDHSAVSNHIVYSIRHGVSLDVALGTQGVFDFMALSAVLRAAPAVIAPAMLAILRGENGTRERGRPPSSRRMPRNGPGTKTGASPRP